MPTYKLNLEHNGIEIYFASKPQEAVLQELRNGGWRWHNGKKCWFRKQTPMALQTAKKLCGETKNDQSSPSKNISSSTQNSVTLSQATTQNGINRVVSTVTIEKTSTGYNISSTSNQIICVDCGKFHSIHAQQCPFCGCPLFHTADQYYQRYATGYTSSTQQIEEDHARQEEEQKRKEAQEREKLYNELAPGLLKSRYYTYRAWMGSFISREELDRYSLSDLREFVEKEHRRKIITAVPKEYRDYFGLNKSKRDSMSMAEVDAELKKAEEYRKYVKMLLDDVKAQAKQHHDEVKPSFEAYCRKISERRRMVDLVALRQKKEAAFMKAYSLQKGECICEKCNRGFRGTTKLCPECQRNVGLDAELKKLELKISSFWKNLRVMGGSMTPVGLSDDRRKKYEKYTKGLDYQRALDWFNSLSVNLGDLPLDKYKMSDADVEKVIEIYYREVSSRLTKEKSCEEIVANEEFFAKVSTCLYLGGRKQECDHYVQQYCLRMCDDRIR